VFLIFIVPGRGAGTLLDIGDASSSSDPRDEGDEGGEGGKDSEPRKLEKIDHAVRAGARSRPVDTASRQTPLARCVATLLASIAPKSHSSRLSVQRQQ